jgi:hypothetical protein
LQWPFSVAVQLPLQLFNAGTHSLDDVSHVDHRPQSESSSHAVVPASTTLKAEMATHFSLLSPLIPT